MATGSDLTLTIPRNKLGEFIGSLLGQPRKKERSFEGGHFVATHDWILNIADIFEQRMAQNHHSLVSFRCRYFLENGIIDTVETIDAFRTYNDLSNKTSVGVDISVTYIVDFPGSETPEKQEIRVEVFSDFRLKETASPTAKREKIAKIQFMVNFANMTFGEDVLRHISTYIETIYKRDWVTKIISWWSTGSTIFIASGVIVMVGLFLRYASSESDKLMQIFKSIENNYTPEAQSQKLNILIEQYSNLVDPMALGYLAYSAVISVFFVMVALGGLRIIFNRFNRSFVIFNKYTEDKSTSFLRVNEYIKWAVCVALFIGTIGSLIATHIDRFFY